MHLAAPHPASGALSSTTSTPLAGVSSCQTTTGVTLPSPSTTILTRAASPAKAISAMPLPLLAVAWERAVTVWRPSGRSPEAKLPSLPAVTRAPHSSPEGSMQTA